MMNKGKIAIVYIILMLFFTSTVFAISFDFYRDDGTAGTPFYVGYEGNEKDIQNTIVINYNLACSITCTFKTDQGEDGIVPGVTAGEIPAGKKSPRFSIPVKAIGDSILTTTVTCSDVPGEGICSNSKSISKDLTLTWDYCSDGIIQQDYEICDGGSKTCSTLGSEYYSAKSAPCKDDCSGYDISFCEYCGDGIKNGPEACDYGSQNGIKCSPSYGSSCTYCDASCQIQTIKGSYCGDGNKDPQENCNSCYSDSPCVDGKAACSISGQCVDLDSDENCGAIGNSCAADEECVNKQCKSKCGNGRIDSGENCLTCPKDSGCKDTEQCSSNGKCINIVNDNNNCGSIGHKCDTTPKISDTDKRSCSSDYYKAIAVQQISKEQCKYKTCEKVVTEENTETDCLAKGTYCQDGTCGCSEGYEACEVLKRCVLKKSVQLNEPCGCDFQCEEGFCDDTSSQCVKGLNIKLSSSKSLLSVGDETTVSLSVANPLNKDVNADLILSIGDGVELVEILSGDQCSGSQCKLDKTVIPAGGKKDVTIKIRANSETTALMNAFINYQLGSKKIELKDKTSVKIIECGNGKAEEGETSETCCLDAGCPPDGQFYTFTCNKNTKSCAKSLHSYYIYGGASTLVLVFLTIFGISKGASPHKKGVPEKDKKETGKEAEKEKKKKHKKKEAKKEKHGMSESIAKEIEHFHTLMEKGIITKKEFNKKKKKLLKKNF